MTTPDEVAARIGEARREAGRSVAWLAEASGVADKTLRRRLTAPAGFTVLELAAIARALGIRLEELFVPSSDVEGRAA